MIERKLPSEVNISTPKNLADAILAREPKPGQNFKELLGFLRNEVTVEEFIEDRFAQTFVNHMLNYSHIYDAENYGSRLSNKERNPYPNIECEAKDKEGNHKAWNNKYGVFMLKNDDENLYFFDTGYSLENSFLREQNIILAKDYSMDKTFFHNKDNNIPKTNFNKILERTSIKGGQIYLYNFGTKQWEEEDNYTVSGQKETAEATNRKIIEKIDKSLGINKDNKKTVFEIFKRHQNHPLHA